GPAPSRPPPSSHHGSTAYLCIDSSKTAWLSHAPGMIRTCDLCLRRAALYPLSYGRGEGKCSRGGEYKLPRVTIALQVIVSGLAAGGVYGLFAVGHSLIHRLTGIVNFAFGDLVGLGIFATLLVLAGTTPVSQSGAHEPRFLFALIVGLAVCVLAGAATYIGLVQPYLTRGSTVGWVAGTVAVAFAIRAVIGATFQIGRASGRG